MEELIEPYGYVVVFLGTLLEGGTVLVIAGIAKYKGYLDLLPWVILAGSAGAFIDSQFWYYLGHRYGYRMVEKNPRWKSRLHKTRGWLQHNSVIIIIGVRFIPGLRVPAAVAIGMSDVAVSEYVVINAIGAVLWTSTILFIGYLYGHFGMIIE